MIENKGHKKSSFFPCNGRINRFKYFLLTSLLGILGFTLIIFFNWGLGGFSHASQEPLFMVLVFLIFTIIICQFLLIIKRIHDIDKSNSHLWLIFIPIYNIYFILLLLFKKGTNGVNQYGGDPLINTKKYFNEGVALYEKEKFDLAEKKLKIALENDPTSENIKYNLALVYFEQKKYDESLKLIKEIEDSNVDCSELIAELNKVK